MTKVHFCIKIHRRKKIYHYTQFILWLHFCVHVHTYSLLYFLPNNSKHVGMTIHSVILNSFTIIFYQSDHCHVWATRLLISAVGCCVQSHLIFDGALRIDIQTDKCSLENFNIAQSQKNITSYIRNFNTECRQYAPCICWRNWFHIRFICHLVWCAL